MDRRHFLGAGIASAGLLSLTSVLSQSAPNVGAPTLPAPGYRKLKVGAMEVIAVNDGALRRPLGDEFVRNAPLEQVKALLSSQGLPTDYVDIPFTPYLVVAGNTKFLIDTGFADNGPPTTGRLKANLAAAGHDIASIDHVIISHFHGDHINGLINKDGSQVFPKARIHVPAPEMAFWMDDARIATLPQGVQGAAANAKKVFGAYGDRVVRFEPGSELAPGIRSAAAFGHTPGMSVFTVASEGQSFMYVADVTNIPSLFARSPDWAVAFDMDAEMARQTRRRIFDQLVRDKTTMGGFHFPFPAVGTLEASGSGYQFKALG